ncbi:MAG: hypothetical protein V3R99_03820, partial [Thermoguttaceae bacterium]
MAVKQRYGRNRTCVARNRVSAERSRARPRRRSLAVEPLEQRVLLDAGGILSGTVFNDTDRDGVFDVGESGLVDWTVELQPVGSTDTPELILENPTPDQWSQFGRFVAAVGDNVLVGSHYDDLADEPDAGAAYLFDGTTGEVLHTLISPNPVENDKFGRAVAGFGEDLLIGAPLDDTAAVDSGAVYLFDGQTGDVLRTLLSPTGGINDQFGRAIAAVGNNILVGARFDDSAAEDGSIEDAGAAFLFDGATGELLQTFQSPTPAGNAQFGYSVSPMGENVLIGARYDETGAAGLGAVYLFDSATGNLLQTFRNPTQRASGDPSGFGRSVAAVGDNVLVGARLDDSGVDGAGSAFLFDGATGVVLHVFTSPTPVGGEDFGFDVAASGDDVLVGARWDNRWDGLNQDSGGAVYLFDAATGQLMQTFANPSPAAWDAFGCSVAMLGDRIVVGARDGNAAYVFDAIHESAVTTSAADGSYSFTDLEPGDYRILTEGRESFSQTFPDGHGAYSVTISDDLGHLDLDFCYVENEAPIGRNDL